MNKLKIVFMGTPEFAVGILDTILKQNQHEIVGVITAPDKPAGRGQKIKYSDVKDYALEKNLKFLQPTNLKDLDFLSELKALGANLFIIVAFRMLPKAVWSMPEYGTFNLHASLLPNYRGAAPINWAIINGETKTGVTTFFIDDKIDTGAIILSKEIAISETENAGNLHDRLMILGSEAVSETLNLIAKKNVHTTIQEEYPNIKTAYKLDKENCKIDFSKNADEIYNLIRGLSPYPTAWCNFKDDDKEWNIKIYEAKKELFSHEYEVGKLITTKKEIKMAVLGGFIHIISLQFPGKKKMLAHELLNGINFSENTHAF
ncbi:methionyl-tRNA formyltransferase [Flavobacterium sp.]|uniref:methionyl-tRNA formyltransferase n=1 Tax=Flavobacterium sp. TaxID=239 RepID=UPI00286C4F56|nr:methionyl-tRNA formyltransferase [Flavobacterium sp.]